MDVFRLTQVLVVLLLGSRLAGADELNKPLVAKLLASSQQADWVQAAKLIGEHRSQAIELLPEIHRASSFPMLRDEFHRVLAVTPGSDLLRVFQKMDERGKIALMLPIRQRVDNERLAVSLRVDSADARAAFEHAIPDAKTPLLRSSLLSTWWTSTDHKENLSPTLGEIVFEWLEDDRIDPNGSKKAPPPTPREVAIRVLGTCNGQFDARVYEMLSDSSVKRRAAAVAITAARTPITTSSLDRVFELAKDPEALVRSQVAVVLGRAPARHEEAATQLVAFLDEEDPAIVNHSAEALASIAPKVSPEKQSTIAKSLLDVYRSKATVEWRAGMTLTSMMSGLTVETQRHLVHEMLPLLEKDNPGNRWIWRAIAEAGPNASEALPHFRRRFVESNPKEQLRFAQLLWQVERDPGSVYPIYIAAVKRKSSIDRYYGFNGLEAMGPEASQAVPTMIEMLSHKKSTVVLQALDVLKAIGSDAAPAIPAVKKLLQSKDERLVEAADGVLQSIRGTGIPQ